MSAIRKLFRHFAQFLAGFSAVLLLNFLTFPILTRLLSREEYGILGLVTTTMALAVAVAKGGISDAIIRYYAEYAETTERRTILVSTVLTRGVLLAAVITGAYALTLPQITALIGVKANYLRCFEAMTLYLLIRPLNIIVGNFLRATGNIFLLNLVNVFTKIIEIALGFALLLWLIGELYGYVLGIALAEFCASLILFTWMFRHFRFSMSQVSGPLTGELVKFGIPLLLTELAYLLLSYVARYMIVAYHGEDMLGLYSVGYNVPAYISNIVMFSVSYAVVPIYTELYKREGKAATSEFLGRAMKYYVIGVIPLCFGYAAVAHDTLVTLASEKYAEAATFSPIILISLVFLGLNYILYAGLYLEKKSGQILAVMLCAVALNIIANLALLPRYGAEGAAVATLLACLGSSALMMALGRRQLAVPMPVSTIAYYMIVSGIMYVAVQHIETSRPWLNLVVRIPFGALIIGVAVLAREREIRVRVLALANKFGVKP